MFKAPRTLALGIKKGENNNLVVYTNSDWAGCIDDWKSSTGYLFCIGSRAVSWASKKRQTTSLSSTEAGYIVATATACHAVWSKRILADLKHKQDGAIVIFCDNKSAIA